jgi:predicted HAD superfamily Cof-like phosphohydrolase
MTVIEHPDVEMGDEQMPFTLAIDRVREFHRHIGAPIASETQLLPGKPKAADFIGARIGQLGRLARRGADNDPFLERLALALEELSEWAMAHAEQDLVAAADAWADRAYVLMGDAVSCGLPAQELFEEVHRSNMSKMYGIRTACRQGVSWHGLRAAENSRDSGSTSWPKTHYRPLTTSDRSSSQASSRGPSRRRMKWSS